MKMNSDTYAALKASVEPIMTHVLRVNGDVSERLRWDCLWSSKFPVHILYNEGLTDAHIDSALKAIAKGCYHL